jgi:DNA mismatch endonuclease (patch repair protein)
MQGHHVPHSKEAKLKMRLSHLGRKDSLETKENKRLAQLGRKATKETKQKLRLSKLGEKNPCFGKPAWNKDLPAPWAIGNQFGKGVARTEKEKKHLSEFQIAHPNKHFKDTSIERKIEAELKKRGLKYQKQIPLCKVAIVDFLLKEINTVIQADGCYWHGCPEHYPNNIKTKEKDKNKDMILGLNGYKVIRFWEHEINKSVEECIDKILIT